MRAVPAGITRVLFPAPSSERKALRFLARRRGIGNARLEPVDGVNRGPFALHQVGYGCVDHALPVDRAFWVMLSRLSTSTPWMRIEPAVGS